MCFRRFVLLLLVVLALAVVAGHGVSTYAWTGPAALNTNAATDSGNDYFSQVTTDGAGNWVAVWESHDSLGGCVRFWHDARAHQEGIAATEGIP